MPSSEWPDDAAVEAAVAVIPAFDSTPEDVREGLTAAAKASPVIPAPNAEQIESAAFDLYAGGPYGGFEGFRDKGARCATDAHSMGVYRAIVRSVLESLGSASPVAAVIPAAKCETCEGAGKRDLGFSATSDGRLVLDCPDCHGTGVAEVAALVFVVHPGPNGWEVDGAHSPDTDLGPTLAILKRLGARPPILKLTITSDEAVGGAWPTIEELTWQYETTRPAPVLGRPRQAPAEPVAEVIPVAVLRDPPDALILAFVRSTFDKHITRPSRLQETQARKDLAAIAAFFTAEHTREEPTNA